MIKVFTCRGVLVCSYTPPLLYFLGLLSSAVGNANGLFIDKAGNVLVADRGTDSKVIITDKNNNLVHKLVPGQGGSCFNV